jgi:hypothetical protein
MSQSYAYAEQSDPTGGFSSATLLLLSLSGLTVVFVGLLIISLKAPNKSADDEEDESAFNYDQALQDADVSTLTRSQRRARAKLLMKKNRRITKPETQPDLDENGQPVLNNEEHVDETVDADEKKLTRKQRQLAAKKLERAERKMNEDQIRIHNKILDEERKIREAALLNKSIQAANEKKEKRENDFVAWKYMFPESDFETKVTVKEFVEELEIDPVISLEETADEFSTTVPNLIRRLKELEDDGRIRHGILNAEDDEYIFINEECMKRLVKHIKEKGKVHLDDFAKEITRIVRSDRDCAESKDTLEKDCGKDE